MSNLSDVIGGANMDGSLINISFVNDRFCNANSAIFFNNASALKVPPGVYFSGDFTITIWIYLKAFQSHNTRLIDFGNGNYADTVFAFYNSMQIKYFISLNSTTKWSYGMSTNSLIELNKWYHVTFTLSGTTGYVYVNGSLAVNRSTMIVPRNILRNLNYIGLYYAIAIFDDLKFYQGAMSQAQILNDYIISSNNGIFLFFFR